MHHLLLFTLFLICAFADPSSAQEKDHPLAPVITPNTLNKWDQKKANGQEYYERTLRQLQSDPTRMKELMHSLRNYYPMTQVYVPFSRTLIEELTQYAYTADTTKDVAKSNQALTKYRQLVSTHLANLDVIDFALMMSRSDVKFGDEFFYKKVYDSLIESLYYGKKDGLSAESAYRIVTYGEETYVLSQYDGEVRETELFKVGGQYYNVHSIDLFNGEFIQLYTNITAPVIAEYYQKALQRRQESVPNVPNFQ